MTQKADVSRAPYHTEVACHCVQLSASLVHTQNRLPKCIRMFCSHYYVQKALRIEVLGNGKQQTNQTVHPPFPVEPTKGNRSRQTSVRKLETRLCSVALLSSHVVPSSISEPTGATASQSRMKSRVVDIYYQ